MQLKCNLSFKKLTRNIIKQYFLQNYNILSCYVLLNISILLTVNYYFTKNYESIPNEKLLIYIH